MRARDAIEQAHKTCISATMAATIAGVSPWSSPYELWCRFKGMSPRAEETYAMRRGSFMEPGIIKEFQRETKLRVRRPRRVFDPNFWFVSEEYGFPMGALLDGITEDSAGPAVVEAKTAGPWAASEWLYEDGEDASDNDRVPMVYFMQVQHQLAVTGWEHAYVPADVGGKFLWRLIRRDEGVIELLTDRERAFWWNNVVADEPPKADGNDATSAAIRARWPRSTPEYAEVINDPEVVRLAGVYVAQSRVVREVESERDGIANQLKTVLEDRELVQAGDYKISWKTQTRTAFDTKAFRAAHPALAEEFSTKSEVRPLKVTGPKE